ncbi:hypothetical protein PK28_02760 [Hymenobacter sp. DG25B]|uniref:hypothetical protein n=1 Tax=Hymenobacter sp. DG25B TaxID=1385664 RepID=UPI0005410B80|nr:hypothetical protein [Hymenobacter sp. DG25B]AIZ62874.1 hypothetical protein PK28_02760 [Hymenobacter sp. DG25B]
MKKAFFAYLPLLVVLTLSTGCNTDKRTDGTAGEVVSDMDKAADEGGVQADATVIDNNAGPTVTADADSMAAAMDTAATR